MTKLLYFVSIGILALWILRGESVAVGSEDTQIIKISDRFTSSGQLLAQIPDSESEDPTAQPAIPEAEVPEPEVPEKSNTITNLIQSTDPEERENVLRQELGNRSGDTRLSPSETISVPSGRDPFSVIPNIPVPDVAPEPSSVAQLPEIQGQQLRNLPTLPATTIPTTWQRNVVRIVPSDDSLREIRRRPPSEPDPISGFDSTFVERGC
ncbi:MAG: hypothetical protein QNJ68_04715 [Microcoleaceae cyanobacterium MO_207.B10]|nr:hypothetical protein [Microcoleaceae cyanobacterium MO_207.B10]